MAVVPCRSDVLCTHKTRLQLLYTDVQQLKMVQMLAQPSDFAIYIYSSDAFALLKNNAQKEGNVLNIFGTVAMILCTLDAAFDYLQDIIAVYRKGNQYPYNHAAGDKGIEIQKRLKLQNSDKDNKDDICFK